MTRRHLTTTQGLLDHLAYRDWQNRTEIGTHLPTAEVVRSALMNLPARQRDLLLCRHYERLSYRQIARRFGWINPQSAHWAVGRAERHLAARLRRRLGKDL